MDLFNFNPVIEICKGIDKYTYGLAHGPLLILNMAHIENEIFRIEQSFIPGYIYAVSHKIQFMCVCVLTLILSKLNALKYAYSSYKMERGTVLHFPGQCETEQKEQNIT